MRARIVNKTREFLIRQGQRFSDGSTLINISDRTDSSCWTCYPKGPKFLAGMWLTAKQCRSIAKALIVAAEEMEGEK